MYTRDLAVIILFITFMSAPPRKSHFQDGKKRNFSMCTKELEVTIPVIKIP